MINILIPTQVGDAHAIAIQLALERKGHRAVRWFATDFPSRQHGSFAFKENSTHWEISGPDAKLDSRDQENFDVIWYRRPGSPVLPGFIHQDDRLIAQRENREFCNSFWHLVAQNAFWVNPLVGYPRNKIIQLQIASKMGFCIPNTLISNDPRKIRQFIRSNSRRGSIYKSLLPMSWTTNDKGFVTYTSAIKEEDLPADNITQATPGIFQELLPKAFELRVTCFGSYQISAKLLSQEHPMGKLDWRAIPDRELTIQPFQLPEKIHGFCRKFMHQIGVVFGCFDFIVTPEGEYYFLELNEQGQFLWIEINNPELMLLDTFTEFLINKSVNFEWKKTHHSIPYQQVQNSNQFNSFWESDPIQHMVNIN